jgi:excisionase family DNA binding protein
VGGVPPIEAHHHHHPNTQSGGTNHTRHTRHTRDAHPEEDPVTRTQPQLGFLLLDEETRRYLVRAALIGRRFLLDRGHPPPLALDAIIATIDAKDCHTMPTVGPGRNSCDAVFITVQEAAIRLSISTRSAWRLIGSGRLPSVLIAGRRLVPADAIDTMAEEAS